MTDSTQLLRMLEPALRPAAPRPTGVTPTQQGQQPFESKSFDALLAEAKQMVDVSDLERVTATTATQAPDSPAETTPSLRPLASIDRIDNPSLRDMVARAHNPQDDSALPKAI